MEIQKVFSDYYDEERYYSILMTEEELTLFSDLEERIFGKYGNFKQFVKDQNEIKEFRIQKDLENLRKKGWGMFYDKPVIEAKEKRTKYQNKHTGQEIENKVLAIKKNRDSIARIGKHSRGSGSHPNDSYYYGIKDKKLYNPELLERLDKYKAENAAKKATEEAAKRAKDEARKAASEQSIKHHQEIANKLRKKKYLKRGGAMAAGALAVSGLGYGAYRLSKKQGKE